MAQQLRDATATMFAFADYEDPATAIDWLEQAFGFERKQVHEGDEGAILHAELALGAGVFMLSSAGDNTFGLKTPRELGAVTGGVYAYVEDVDAHYERARAAGAEIVRELADTSYGAREYMARDLEGHLWSFGSYLPE